MLRRKKRIHIPAESSSQVDLFWEGDDFFNSVIADLDSANVSICLESYIFHSDHTGERVIQSLLAAARRGVRIRVLVDGVGSFPLWNLRRYFRNSTAAFRVFKPVGLFSAFKSGFHRRDHRKLVLVDDRIAYTGGMNIGDELSLEVRGNRRWRDNMMRVEGGDFWLLQQSFDELWTYAGKKSFGLMPRSKISRRYLGSLSPFDPGCPDIFYLSNHSRVLRRRQRHVLVQLIKKARNRIYIGSAYFIPARSILWLLRRKAAQGVDVRVITAGKSDVWLARQAGRSTYGSLLKHGIRVFEFDNRMFHAKMTIVDDRFMVGSTNMDYRSFLHNLEVDAWVCRKSTVARAVEQWHIDESSSRRIHRNRWKKRSILEKILEKIAFLLRFYL
ncbi:MAG: phospholipase D-like domain-containing protein [Leptospiraceae bacterium]